MAKKRKTKSKGKKANNGGLIFLIIVMVLALLSYAISYFVTETNNEAARSIEKTNNIEQVKKANKKTVKTVKQDDTSVLEGTWASYSDGAMLTVKGNSFTIELPSVQSSKVASGRITIHGNTVTFVYTNKNSTCGVKPGTYNFVIDNEEVTFDVAGDDCPSRVVVLSATWFKV